MSCNDCGCLERFLQWPEALAISEPACPKLSLKDRVVVHSSLSQISSMRRASQWPASCWSLRTVVASQSCWKLCAKRSMHRTKLVTSNWSSSTFCVLQIFWSFRLAGQNWSRIFSDWCSSHRLAATWTRVRHSEEQGVAVPFSGVSIQSGA